MISERIFDPGTIDSRGGEAVSGVERPVEGPGVEVGPTLI
jgi:hypothetical protein